MCFVYSVLSWCHVLCCGVLEQQTEGKTHQQTQQTELQSQ